MTEQNAKIDGRTKRALDLAIAKRQVSQESYRAVLAGEITLQQAKERGRDRGPDGAIQGHRDQDEGQGASRSASPEDRRDEPLQPISRISKDDKTQECWCGCEELTSPNRRWKPGHDQRAKGIIRRAVKDGKVAELPPQLREYGKERGLI